MIRILYCSGKGELDLDYPPARLEAALADKRGLVWVDWLTAAPSECEPVMRDVFGFHPLAIDDALREEHVPKLDDWGEYLYIALHGIAFKREWDALDTHELDVFLGGNFLVTYHFEPIPAIDRVWTACGRDTRHVRGGPDHLLYEAVDGVIADYMHVVDELDEAIDVIEDEVFERPTPKTLERIFALKRAVLRLRRILSPQREVLNKLARDDYKVIDAKDRVYFRDVYDHIVRLYDLNESLRDLVASALDTYLSVSANKTNQIMKVLTVVTTLFMPVSFLSGFWGMNFFGPMDDPGWANSVVMAGVLATMVLVPLTMAWWMRRQGWVETKFD
ncbi:MAG: magnesium/cobalt transporter CorA [Thermoflexales bacterium]|nr:magnesium/cobalt transporter CorA [Thermoflexales bacterium]